MQELIYKNAVLRNGDLRKRVCNRAILEFCSLLGMNLADMQVEDGGRFLGNGMGALQSVRYGAEGGNCGNGPVPGMQHGQYGFSGRPAGGCAVLRLQLFRKRVDGDGSGGRSLSELHLSGHGVCKCTFPQDCISKVYSGWVPYGRDRDEEGPIPRLRPSGRGGTATGGRRLSGLQLLNLRNMALKPAVEISKISG